MGINMRVFFLKRWGCDPGEVDLLPKGLKIEQPKSVAKRLALTLIIGPAGTSAKEEAFIIPYDRIKDLKITGRKPASFGPERPFIELTFLDSNSKVKTITFAPIEGFIAKYKSEEFMKKLKSNIKCVSITT